MSDKGIFSQGARLFEYEIAGPGQSKVLDEISERVRRYQPEPQDRDLLLSFLNLTHWSKRPDDLETLVGLFMRAWADKSLDAAFDFVGVIHPGTGIHGVFAADRQAVAQTASITWDAGDRQIGAIYGRAGTACNAHMIIIAALELMQAMWIKHPASVKGPPVPESGPPFNVVSRLSSTQ